MPQAKSAARLTRGESAIIVPASSQPDVHDAASERASLTCASSVALRAGSQEQIGNLRGKVSGSSQREVNQHVGQAAQQWGEQLGGACAHVAARP